MTPIHSSRRRWLVGLAATTLLTAGLSAPAVAQDAAATKPVAMIPAEERTSEQWMEYLGIVQVADLDPVGDQLVNPKPGDLYFLTNESTTWGATNTRNNAVLIDADTREVAAVSALPDEWSLGFGSHGIAASSDGKYVYLPALKGDVNVVLILDGKTLQIDKIYQSMGRPHHINNYTSPDGRELIMIIDFGWNWTGSGIWVLDPAQDNAVVGGMSRADFSGNPYIVSREVGENMWVAVPAATSALREEIDGFLARINLTTWKVEQAIPMLDPIWPEVAIDGKTAWVTLGGPGKIAKVDLEKGEVIAELATGPGPWGARLNYDESKLYTADKGEARGYGQQGITSTVYDTAFDIATNVIVIGKTTDHIILRPDGTELWATSNADHNIHVIDATTEEVVAIIPMPNDGDTHGSTFIAYTDDGNGGVAAEVVSSFGGLRGSALAAQKTYIAQPRVEIAVGRSGFVAKELKVEASSDPLRLIIINNGGTSTGAVTFDAPDLGITGLTLMPGERHETEWVPVAGSYVATTNKAPNSELPITVSEPAPEPTAEATGVHEIAINATNYLFELSEFTVKAGETVRFVITNADDEKHNLVGIGEGLNLLGPDVDPGVTTVYEWVVPAEPGEFMVLCAYHPAMVMTMTIEA